MSTRVGFIGQGWIGKHYADDFETRGFSVVRYSLEPEYAMNKEALATCAYMFIAVPTPTTPEGFDDSYLRAVLPLVADGAVAVIKSTVLPGTTQSLQEEFPSIRIVHSPEFLREAHAAHDAAHPVRNIIGIPIESDEYRALGEDILALLPHAPYSAIMPARSAELVKYAGNVFLYMKVVFANMLYDLAREEGADYEALKDALAADPRIGASHLQPVDASGHSEKAGRGAGGHCFIKDMEAFRTHYKHVADDTLGDAVLRALVEKNNALLKASKKDLELLAQVYGTL